MQKLHLVVVAFVGKLRVVGSKLDITTNFKSQVDTKFIKKIFLVRVKKGS